MPPDVTYEIVQRDGGWAYKVNGAPPAQAAAGEQQMPGHAETIEYEDEKGKWHTETASGRDRPHTVVKDRNRVTLVDVQFEVQLNLSAEADEIIE